MLGLFRKKQVFDTVGKKENSKLALQDLSMVIPILKAIVSEDKNANTVELPKDDAPIYKEFAADLLIFYVLDLPDSFQYINNRFLRENNLSFEDIHLLALQNLPNRLPKIEMHGNSPYHMITAGGNFEATLLLLDSLWDQLAEHLPGEPMAAIPSRDLLFVTGSEAENAVSFMSDMANKDLADNSHALSKCFFVRRSGKWISCNQ